MFFVALDFLGSTGYYLGGSTEEVFTMEHATATELASVLKAADARFQTCKKDLARYNSERIEALKKLIEIALPHLPIKTVGVRRYAIREVRTLYQLPVLNEQWTEYACYYYADGHFYAYRSIAGEARLECVCLSDNNFYKEGYLPELDLAKLGEEILRVITQNVPAA